jgi:hypothetical protein
MEDSVFGSADLTGRWTGFYRFRSEGLGHFPIVAEILQEGTRISGEMYDQITEWSDSLNGVLDRYSQDIDPLSKWAVKAAYSPQQIESIEVSWRLPDTSDIEGKIQGDQITFTKIYRGSAVHKHKNTMDGSEVGSLERRRHTVYYSGQLEGEKGCIVGEWVIKWRGVIGQLLPPKARGTFELYRKS